MVGKLFICGTVKVVSALFASDWHLKFFLHLGFWCESWCWWVWKTDKKPSHSCLNHDVEHQICTSEIIEDTIFVNADFWMNRCRFNSPSQHHFPTSWFCSGAKMLVHHVFFAQKQAKWAMKHMVNAQNELVAIEWIVGDLSHRHFERKAEQKSLSLFMWVLWCWSLNFTPMRRQQHPLNQWSCEKGSLDCDWVQPPINLCASFTGET